MDALTKPKRKNGVSAKPKKPPYPDLHDHIRALDKAGLLDPRRPADQQRHRDAPAGALAVPRRHRGEGPQGVPVHQRHRQQGPQVRHPGAGRRARRQPRDLPHRRRLPVRRDRRALGQGRGSTRCRRASSTNAPCHEIVITGKALDKPGQGLDGIPLPISTPGWDIAPYATLSQYITKDPDTGVQNMGNYRGQVKARRRLGMNPSLELRPGIYNHWEKLRERGFKKLPCAVVLGAPPVRHLRLGAEAAGDARRAARRRRAGRRADQRGEGQDRRPAGAGRGRDRHRGLHRHRISRAGGAVRRIARPRQPAGIQRLHGRHRHHAAARRHPHLDHLPGDAVGIEPDQAHRHGAAVPATSCATRSASRASSACRCTSR